MKYLVKMHIGLFVALILTQSCVSKKHVLYIQDDYEQLPIALSYDAHNIQIDDILDIRVSTLVPEASAAYNRRSIELPPNTTLDNMKLEGYLVSQDMTINFPVLGTLTVANKSLVDLENDIRELLVSNGELVNPTVTVRLVNSKVTVLGEVNSPGTFSFTENSISFLQALGLAGDLTINGNREDVLLIRNIDGILTTKHLNLTSADWLVGPYERIRPNDVIIVHPNRTKIMSRAFFGNSSSFVSLVSLGISTTALIINLSL